MTTTTYGSAANGMTYSGRTVGSGWDCTIRCESHDTALVNFVRPNRSEDYLAVIDIEPDADLQALAIDMASHPAGPHIDGLGAVCETDGDAWDAIADRWNALLDDAGTEDDQD
jgi:hypothetical protein